MENEKWLASMLSSDPVTKKKCQTEQTLVGLLVDNLYTCVSWPYCPYLPTKIASRRPHVCIHSPWQRQGALMALIAAYLYDAGRSHGRG